MTDITELERRISAAFDRIDQGLEVLARSRATIAADAAAVEGAPDAAAASGAAAAAASGAAQTEAVPAPTPAADTAPHLASLVRTLETANAATAEWAERYRALEAQASAETLALASEIARLTASLETAQQPVVIDTAAKDSAMAAQIQDHDAEIDELTARIAQQEAELETLRALRSSEADELGAIIAALEPLITEVPYV